MDCGLSRCLRAFGVFLVLIVPVFSMGQSIASVTLNPGAVIGGNSVTGTVALSAAAPAGGSVVKLTSTNSIAPVPTSVTVPKGSTSANFTINTGYTSLVQSATISGILGGVKTATLAINPILVVSIKLDKTAIVGGNTVNATFILSDIAPPGGAPVSLASTNKIATVPTIVTVTPGLKTFSFTVTTSPTSLVQTAGIQAIIGRSVQSATLTVNPLTVQSLTLNPTSVVGGSLVSGTVTLSDNAPSATNVLLSSTNSIAKVPSTVTVASGSNSANFTVTTLTTGTVQTAKIQAISGGTAQAVTLTLNPLTVQSLAFVPASVVGGDTAVGTVTLNGSPTADTVVPLKSDSSFAPVPSSVIVKAGSPTATFNVPTTVVTTASTANITATYRTSSQTTPLTVNPVPALVSASISPTTVIGGNPVSGTVTLSGPAPMAGAIVSLAGDIWPGSNVGVIPPLSVTVLGGQTTASFPVTVAAVTKQQVGFYQASYNGVSIRAPITVNPPPPTVQSVVLNSSSVYGGTSVGGTVTLSNMPPTDTVVNLSANGNPFVSVPPSVTVMAGYQSVGFTIATKVVTATSTASISANCGTSSQSAALTISPLPSLTAFTLSPSSINAGGSTVATIRISSGAPPSGAVINLSSSDSADVIMASTVTIPARANAVTFQVVTRSTTTPQAIQIKATYQGVTQTATLSVYAVPTIKAVTLNPPSVIGGNASVGTVALMSNALADTVVTLSANGSTVATVPVNVTVKANTSSATFTVTTSSVTSVSNVNITATFGTSSQSATLTVNPVPALASVSLLPSTINGSDGSVGTVVLTANVITDTVVNLSATGSNVVTVPTSVTLKAGTSSAPFNITTQSTATAQSASISASFQGVVKSATLTVNQTPPPIQLTLTPTAVIGGNQVMGKITLTYAPDVDTVINLSSDSSVATVPASVTVKAKTNSAPFTITTGAAATTQTVTIKADDHYNTQSATLTVNVSPIVQSLVFDLTTILGGTNAVGTVTLKTASPADVVLALKSDSIAAIVPASVTVKAGSTSATFKALGNIFVTSPSMANITASYLASSQTAAITVNPPISLKSVTLSPATIQGGISTTGTVTLNEVTPTDTVVNIASDNPTLASVPASITVKAGTAATNFSVSTSLVTSVAIANITASYSFGLNQSAALTVNPPPKVVSVSMNPSTILGSNTSTGTVTLSFSTSNDIVVNLSANGSAFASVPATVTVKAGDTSATFSVATTNVAATSTANITATYFSSSQSTSLTVNPSPTVVSVSFHPTAVVGGNPSTGTVTLSLAVANDIVVKLSANGSLSAAVPSTVTVKAGTTSASFIVTTSNVTSQFAASITATYLNSSQSGSLSIWPIPAVQSVNLNPTSVVAGNSSTGTVTLQENALTDTVVSLASNGTFAQVPATVTVKAGTASATFTVTTTGVDTQATASISATYLASSQSASLTVISQVSSVTIVPSPIYSQDTATGTVTLLQTVSVDTTVGLSFGRNVAGQSSVVVKAGTNSATFPVNILKITGSPATGTVSATFNGSSLSGSVAIYPRPTLSTFTISPATVVTGTSATGTVTFATAVLYDQVINLNSNLFTQITIPASVTVKAGTTSISFPIATNSLPATTPVVANITASYFNQTQQLFASITINPK